MKNNGLVRSLATGANSNRWAMVAQLFVLVAGVLPYVFPVKEKYTPVAGDGGSKLAGATLMLAPGPAK